MTRPLSPAQIAELTKVATFSGECLILAARDGTRARFTTVDLPQEIDLGLGAGVETCSDGFEIASMTLAAGLESSYAEVRGPLGPVLTRAAIEGGKWKGAQAWLVRVWPRITGWAPLLAGTVAEARTEDPRFVLQIRNAADALSQNLEWLVTGYCRWRYGSVECGGTPVETTGTVTAAGDGLRLSVSHVGTFVSGFFALGELEFTSGELDGLISENLFTFTSTGAGTADLVLDTPLPALPAVGDTVILREGCAKIRAACVEKQGDATRFGGEPDVPGTEQLWKYPNPGGGT